MYLHLFLALFVTRSTQRVSVVRFDSSVSLTAHSAQSIDSSAIDEEDSEVASRRQSIVR